MVLEYKMRAKSRISISFYRKMKLVIVIFLGFVASMRLGKEQNLYEMSSFYNDCIRKSKYQQQISIEEFTLEDIENLCGAVFARYIRDNPKRCSVYLDH